MQKTHFYENEQSPLVLKDSLQTEQTEFYSKILTVQRLSDSKAGWRWACVKITMWSCRNYGWIQRCPIPC